MRTGVAVALCAAACLGSAQAAIPIACQMSVVPLKSQTNNQVDWKTLPALDYLNLIVGCNSGPGNRWKLEPALSPWVDGQRGLYAKTLGKTKAEVLVAPFQVQGYGIDRIERALMSADLAYEI